MFTALSSLLTNRPIRKEVAMTGEITLRGLVLPIGGLKEKTLAAKRAGITDVVIPRRNEKDLVDVPEEVRKALAFHPVDHVDEVLKMTVEEAVEFFAEEEAATRGLRPLVDVGLGYLRLGQPATTLSGGEAQRIKIASHLGSQTGERILYVLDEPTTGLHFDDIVKLLAAFRKLLNAWHSLLVIEHNLDVLKTADWIIDLGPEGGEDGGQIVAVGTPEDVAEAPGSHTGGYLRRVISAGREHVHADPG